MDLIDDVDAVDLAVDALVAGQREGLNGSANSVITSSLWDLERDVVLLEAARTRMVGEWVGRGLHGLDGSRSPSARLARETGCSANAAAIVVRRARKLRTMPATTAAFERGELSTDKVDELCRANGKARRARFAEAEERLVSDAKRLCFADLQHVLAVWRNAADAEAANDAAQRDIDGSHFAAVESYRKTVDLRGRLDPVRGAIVRNELERLEQHLWERDWAAARAEWGDAATTDKVTRTPAQRRAAAITLMAERSAAMEPGSTPTRPLFTVIIDHETAQQVCELSNGTVVAPGHLAPFIATADLERVVFGPAGRVLDVGRRSRFFRGGLRRAIEVRDRHCTFPGCREPAERCDVDHIVEWTDGGETTQDNGRLRCGPHNRQRPGRSTPAPPDPIDDPDDEGIEPPEPGP